MAAGGSSDDAANELHLAQRKRNRADSSREVTPDFDHLLDTATAQETPGSSRRPRREVPVRDADTALAALERARAQPERARIAQRESSEESAGAECAAPDAQQLQELALEHLYFQERNVTAAQAGTCANCAQRIVAHKHRIAKHQVQPAMQGEVYGNQQSFNKQGQPFVGYSWSHITCLHGPQYWKCKHETHAATLPASLQALLSNDARGAAAQLASEAEDSDSSFIEKDVGGGASSAPAKPSSGVKSTARKDKRVRLQQARGALQPAPSATDAAGLEDELEHDTHADQQAANPGALHKACVLDDEDVDASQEDSKPDRQPEAAAEQRAAEQEGADADYDGDSEPANPLAGKLWGSGFAPLEQNARCAVLEELGLGADKAYELLSQATKAMHSADEPHIAFATFCGFVADMCHPGVAERDDAIDVQPWRAVKAAEFAGGARADIRAGKKDWHAAVEDALVKDLAVAAVQDAADSVRRACMNATQQRFHRGLCHDALLHPFLHAHRFGEDELADLADEEQAAFGDRHQQFQRMRANLDGVYLSHDEAEDPFVDDDEGGTQRRRRRKRQTTKDGEGMQDSKLRCPACNNPEVDSARHEAHFFTGPQVMALDEDTEEGEWQAVQPGWCSLPSAGYHEFWRRARTDRAHNAAHTPAGTSEDTPGDDPVDAPEDKPGEDDGDSEPSEGTRRYWLMGPTCATRVTVWHAAHHFLLRCVLRIRAELMALCAEDGAVDDKVVDHQVEEWTTELCAGFPADADAAAAPAPAKVQPGVFLQLYLALWALQMAANSLDSSYAVIALPRKCRSSLVADVLRTAQSTRKSKAVSSVVVDGALEAMGCLLGSEEDLKQLHRCWKSDSVLWGGGADSDGDSEGAGELAADDQGVVDLVGGADEARAGKQAHAPVRKHSRQLQAGSKQPGMRAHNELEDDIPSDDDDTAAATKPAQGPRRSVKVVLNDDD